MSSDYTLSITLPGGFQIDELLELSQLIHRRYPTTSMEFADDQRSFIISIPAKDLLEDFWAPHDRGFFNGLILLGLIQQWAMLNAPEEN